MIDDIKIIDTFSFNGDLIVKLRLKYLFEVVDKFVITESRYTHSGEKKPFLFKDHFEEWFKPYESKINWVIVDEFPELTEKWLEKYQHHSWMQRNCRQAWFNETYQRDAVASYIQNKYAGLKYIIIASDVDEIPNTDIFKKEFITNIYTQMDKDPIYLEMDMFYYNFNWLKQYKWYRAYLLKDIQLTEQYSLSYWRVSYNPNYTFRNAGWHFSYFFKPEDIQRKLVSFAHQEYNDDRWKSLDHIKNCITNGIDLFNRNNNEQMVPNRSVKFPEVFYSFFEQLSL